MITCLFVFFKQKTAYEMRISDWSSDVCSSDLNAGVDVLGVDIKQADPPKEVDEAFKDVSASQQDAQKYLNDANAYAQQLTAQAQGEAASFDRVYAEYRLAPEVTRKRMYFETMEIGRAHV